MQKDRETFLDLVVYEVYLRSFCDGNGDGLGDIQGLLQKLDHLQSLGVNTVWLTPCYPSPDADNGYDVANYLTIDNRYGGMEAWKTLLENLHARGMKLMMDLVVNHTSDQHFWFQEAKKSRDNPYHAYYIWADEPLNDWQSVFGGSAWEYNDATDEYYLHLFTKKQVDLNWENPKVREEVRKIVDFWVDLGVDGFRCDVLDHISKDFEKGIYVNGPRLHEYLKELFDREKLKDVFLLGECASDEKTIVDICGAERGELDAVFQFDHIHLGRKGKWIADESFSFDEIKNTLIKWQNFTHKHNLLYTLFTDNHDQPRYLSRLGNDGEFRYECATALATAFFLLKGIPFLYQGQEYGAINDNQNALTAFDDVETKGYYQTQKGKIGEKELLKRMNYGTRDHTRKPVAWTKNPDTGYGFGSKKPWIPLHSKARENNLQADQESEKSVYRYLSKILRLRKKIFALRRGDFSVFGKEGGAFTYLRTFGKEQYCIVCNFAKAQRLQLPNGQKTLLASNYADRTGDDPLFRPFETAVYQLF